MSSYRLEEEKKKEAMNRIGNMFNAVVALLRKRKMRVLGILSPDKIDKDDYVKIATIVTTFFGKLVEKIDECKKLWIQITINHPKFKPEEHFGEVIVKDEQFDVYPVPKDACPEDLRRARGNYTVVVNYLGQVHTYLKKVKIWADAVFSMTGQAIISEMTDFTKEPLNYGVSPEVAASVDETWNQEDDEDED